MLKWIYLLVRGRGPESYGSRQDAVELLKGLFKDFYVRDIYVNTLLFADCKILAA